MNPCTVENIELGPGGVHIIMRAHDTGRRYVGVISHEELEMNPPPPTLESVQLPDGTVEPVIPTVSETTDPAA